MKKSYKQQKVVEDSSKTSVSGSKLKDSLLTKVLCGLNLMQHITSSPADPAGNLTPSTCT